MKYLKLTILFLLTPLIFLSCQDDDRQRQADVARALKQNDSILKSLGKNWKFGLQPASPKVAQRIAGWNEWQQFKAELEEKPSGDLNAYRHKVKNMAAKADNLRNNIPPFFDKPQVRSRISVLITKIKSLYTYINIGTIPEKKVISIINEITQETNSLQKQLNEIVIKSEIPKEIGEEEMLRALDTVRHANPEMIPQQEENPALQPNTPAQNNTPQKLKRRARN